VKIPSTITIEVRDQKVGRALEGGVIILEFLAPRKNNYAVGPKITDSFGRVQFSRSEIEREIGLCQKVSPMDYISNLEECISLKIEMLDSAAIDRLIKARNTWGIGVAEWKLPSELQASLKDAMSQNPVSTTISWKYNDTLPLDCIELAID